MCSASEERPNWTLQGRSLATVQVGRRPRMEGKVDNRENAEKGRKVENEGKTAWMEGREGREGREWREDREGRKGREGREDRELREDKEGKEGRE